jgi:signal transduction histidine kinase/HAMP domain-containing protein
MNIFKPGSSIQTRLIVLVIVALTLLAVILQFIWTVQQRDALVQASRERSLTISSSVSNTIEAVRPLINSLEDITELDDHLAGLVSQNDHVDFIAVVWMDGEVVFHSSGEYKGEQLAALADLPVDETLRQTVPGFGSVYLTTRQVDSADLTGQDRFQIIVGLPVAPVDSNLQEGFITSVLITAVVVVLVSAALIWVLQYTLVRPLGDLTAVTSAIRDGELSLRAEVTREDEIGQLAHSFNAMTEQLAGLIDNLEERVTARTRDIHTAGEVSRQITTMLDIDRLLQEVVTLACDRFDLYASFIFLLDSDQHTMVNAAGATRQDGSLTSTSLGDIPLDAKPSIIASAARSQEVMSVNDVIASDIYMAKAELQHTRAELAVPMMLGSTMLGVFDLQSDHPDHFGPDEISVLTTLAEQVAIAVRNAQLFAEAQEAKQAAEEANEIKSQFLANMSHELRTPLNAILNFTEFVADGVLGPVNQEQVDTLHKAIDSGEHLLSLINDILDLTKIEVGMMDLFLEEIDLNRVITSVLSTAKGLVKDKPQIEIVDNVQDDLPLLVADRRRIRQILLNLISNAVKFTDEGQITISAVRENSEVHLAVKDTGTGIAPEDQSMIFENFRQSREGMQTAGTGLGLPISKHLVEAHDGRMWLESEPGVGSVFHVVLPINQSEMMETAAD